MVQQTSEPISNESATPLVRAAQYVRMSTEHQQYSTLNQEEMILDYAKQRGFEIVKTYADEGKSGLNVAGRVSLRQMISDVQEGNTDYEVILVYDQYDWSPPQLKNH